jgi:hypothetical protein
MGGKGAGFYDDSCMLDNPATNGVSFGGGGGGGNGNGSAPGEGFFGYCVISWCTVDVSTSVTGSTITANGAGATGYQWIDCSSQTPIAGETNASYTATLDGDYAVIVTNGDCEDTSACVSIVGTGFQALKDKGNIEIYPNPFSGQLNVMGIEANDECSLVNAHGQTVWKGKNISKNDFTSLVQGIYMLKIEKGDGIVTRRLVKE